VFALITTLPPVHKLVDPAAVAVAVGNAFTVATTGVLVAVVHPFAVASTKYVVVVAMLGVIKLVPEPNVVPPVAAANQLIVPALAAAVNVTVPVPQRLAAVLDVIVGIAFTVITTGKLVAVGVDKQLAFDVNTTDMLSLFDNDEVINVDELVPTLTPFLLHW
jgi:hypothetical protein